MVMNHQLPTFAHIRPNLAALVLPIQKMVDEPIQFFNWLEMSVLTQQEVLGENARFQAKQLLLEAKLQKLWAVERENQQLRELLTSSSHIAGKMLVAQLLAVDNDPLSQSVTLNRGSRDGVFIGQPLLDAYGVMGQIISVTPFTSQAMLINDIRSAVPVQDSRNDLRSVVVGMGYADQLSLLNISVTSNIAIGDTLVTSGFGGRFPFGYPVGKIVSIQNNAGGRFAVVQVNSAAHLDRSRQVVLLWPPQDKPLTETMPHKNTASK